MKQTEWFPTPLWYDKLELEETKYRDAVHYCINLMETTGGRIATNVGGWQSDGLRGQDIINTPLQPYFDIIIPKISECLKSFGSSCHYFLDTVWININSKGNYNRLHNHPRSIISGTFYLTENNSEIVFERNYDIIWTYLEQIDSKLNTPLSYTSISYKPNKHDLLLFPGWLRHYVETNTQEEKRISVAFNISQI